MRLRGLMLWLALRAEEAFDLFWAFSRRGKPEQPPLLDAYHGFATPDALILRGRVLTALRRTDPAEGQRIWVNFREIAMLFLTDEVAGVQVRAPAFDRASLSDNEGYFWLEVPRSDGDAGWAEVEIEVVEHPDSRVCADVLVPPPEARLGVISDIDDTMIQTGAYSIVRNLWTSLTGNTLTRIVFDDAIALMRRLHDDVNPVFYVSSSPWNLHSFLERLFRRAGLVIGPMFLRDLGIARNQLITGGHGDHKSRAIDQVLDANPALPFILLGDTGQKDAMIYLGTCKRHPGRISAVVLREPGPGPDRQSKEAIAEIEALGIPVLHGKDFTGVAASLEGAEVILPEQAD